MGLNYGSSVNSMEPRASCLPSHCLSILICKIGMKILRVGSAKGLWGLGEIGKEMKTVLGTQQALITGNLLLFLSRIIITS